MEKFVFDSNALPAHLDDRARFSRWHEVFESLVCCVDLANLDDQRFSARFQCARVGGVQINQLDGTMSRIARTATSIARGPDDDFCFLVNRGASPVRSRQLERDAMLAPGAASLISFDGHCETLAGAPSAWVAVTIGRERLLGLTRGAEDLRAQALDHRRPVLQLLRRCLEIVMEIGDVADDDLLDKHIGTTIVDLVALSLGAGRDAAEVARMRGLRAARLQEMLVKIRASFDDPGFSSEHLARSQGLSRRYVNDLLFETGTSFAERVLELRLQKARSMLIDRRHDRLKVSEIAYACGFNEVSYFNRCFRRRFGASPTQCRGGSGKAD